MDYDKFIEDVKVRLLVKHRAVFYTSLFYKFDINYLDNVPGPNEAPIGCIDLLNNVISFRKDFLEDVTVDQAAYLVVHELKHYVFGHAWRVPKLVKEDPRRYASLWNVAGDLIINLTNDQEGFERIPESYGGCFYADFTESGKQYADVIKHYERLGLDTSGIQPIPEYDPETVTSETLFECLVTWIPESSDEESADAQAQKMLGEMSDLEGSTSGGEGGTQEVELTEAQLEQLEQQHVDNLADAMTSTKAAGAELTDPAVRKFLDNLFKTTIPWQRMFRQAISLSGFKHSTYSRLSRRDANLSVRLPSTYSRKAGQISWYIDSSGSISQPLVNAITSEANNLIRVAKPTSTDVWFWDTSMHHAGTFKGKLRNIRILGGGGTTVYKPLQRIKETKPRAAIVFTDGYVNPNELKSFSAKDFAGTQLIWLLPASSEGSFNVEYGKVIYCDEFDNL